MFLSTKQVFCQKALSDSAYNIWKVQRDSDKYKFAKKRHQKFITYEVLDTNAIYMFRAKDIVEPYDSVYSFIRFYKNAVYWSAPYDTIPDSTEFSKTDYGIFAAYKINKKGFLIIERAKQFQMDSRWIYFYGTIEKDKITLTHYYMSYPPFGTSPGKIEPKYGIYRKLKYNFENHLIEWK